MNIKLTLCGLFVALLTGSVSLSAEEASGQTEEESENEQRSEQREENEYLEMVMNILGYHIEAMELLTEQETEYSVNLVRHAAALEDTAGLMEHAYPLEAHPHGDPDKEWPWKSREDFENKANANYKASHELEMAARKWLKDRDTKTFRVSLDKLIKTCRDCHGDLRDWP